MICGWTSFNTLLADSAFMELLETQWGELTHLPDRPPSPDWDRVLEHERLGLLKVWTARINGDIRGFIAWNFIYPLGYPASLWAVDGGWYFDPKRRNAWKALRMWQSSEIALRAMGVEIMRAHDNIKRPLGPFFKRLGFHPVAVNYLKELV